MEADRWRRLQDLYHAASLLPAAQRLRLLDDSCNGDHELRDEVESLLAQKMWADTFLEEPAVHAAARLMARERSDIDRSLSGTTIAHFDILGKLGDGGMGVVFEAVDKRLRRTVALKFLPPTVVSNATALARLEREARAASALNHPNICTIYSIHDENGQPFIEMERLEGQTLRERIAERRFDSDEIVSVALQIIDGMDAAHAKGIVHRDLKPGNVFCTARGGVKILDFGIAKLDSAPDTDSGGVIGTVSYMSPEQASGHPVDARTDLFSFGALLYEMATGCAAFHGSSSLSIRHAVLNDEPAPPHQVNPAVPSALERIILKALRKNRELRYQRASELRADLERLQNRGARRRQHRVIAAGLLLMVVGATAFWYSRRGLDDIFANVRVRQITHNASENSVGSGAISLDGGYMAYTDSRGIHIQSLETGEMRTVPESGNLSNGATWHTVPGWLHDNSGFVVNLLADDVARSSAWVVGLTGPPRKVRDHAQAVSVSPDGSWIVFADDGRQHDYRSIWLLDVNGTTARKLFDAGPRSFIAAVSWSPDGRRIAYLRGDATGRRAAIETRDIVGGPASTIFRAAEEEAVQGPIWLRDGRLLYSVERPSIGTSAGTQLCTHWEISLSITGEPLGEPRRLARWLPQCVASLSITADGKRASYLQSAIQDAIHIVDLDADGNAKTSSRRLTFSEGRNIPSGWTSDSRSVVFVSDSGGRPALFRQPIDADTPQPIAQEPGIHGAARLTPDGAWVIYRGEWRRGDRLMRVPIAGGVSGEITGGQFVDGGARCTFRPASLCAIAERSVDGRYLVFTSIDIDKGRGPELARVAADPSTDYRWALSPDGGRIAFFSATDAKAKSAGQYLPMYAIAGNHDMYRRRHVPFRKLAGDQDLGTSQALHAPAPGSARRGKLVFSPQPPRLMEE